MGQLVDKIAITTVTAVTAVTALGQIYEALRYFFY
jgi:hypothetical protein